MTEFISRNYGNEGYEVIIKTDSHEHYKAAEDFARRLIDHAKPATDNNVGRKWIPVTERLPEHHRNTDGCVCSDVLIFRQKTTVHMGYCVKQIEIIAEEPVVITRWYDQAGHRWEDVTHWMPLPEPPKEE